MIKPVHGQACLEYIEKPVIIGINQCYNYSASQGAVVSAPSHGYVSGQASRQYSLTQCNHTGRVIGWLDGTKDTLGNPQVTLFGNGTIGYNGYALQSAIQTRVVGKITENKVDFSDSYGITFNTWNTHYYDLGTYMWNPISGAPADLPFVTLEWSDYTEETHESAIIRGYCKYHGSTPSNTRTTFNLTTNDNNTLVLGVPAVISSTPTGIYDWSETPMNDVEYFNGWVAETGEFLAGFIYGYNGIDEDTLPQSRLHELQVGDTYTHYLKPYNLLLTESKEEAIRYISTGALPSDVYLYPLDPSDIPQNPAGDDPGGDGEDDPDEDGETPDDVSPTPMPTPYTTPSKIINNNLYWLQTGELASFMNWFWTEAGDIGDLEDLWHKIEGLYNNLGAAIINVRYMPVDISLVGGTTTAPGIVVGQIIKTGNVLKINNAVPTVVTLGTIHIGEKFHSFTDYSPYCELMLYLPYHGYIDIDINLIMKHDLVVKCVYDIISGTVQYFIFRDETMINTVIAKMAVDIPITLQSKSDRDSAIFSNVGNGVANLIGAATSAAAKNPIGLVMSTENLATGGAQSAPLSVKGTIGESGAYFAPNRCAVYIARPRYNRPALYSARVGFPLNKNYKLSSVSGFTTCYNPYIKFSGNKNADNVMQYPVAEEINEIYQLLEKGVIL